MSEPGLFGELPIQCAQERAMPLDLIELDKEINKNKPKDFFYTREIQDGKKLITIEGKGITVHFILNTEHNTIILKSFDDCFATSDGTPCDVAPRPLDTDEIIGDMKSLVEESIREVINPTLVENS